MRCPRQLASLLPLCLTGASLDCNQTGIGLEFTVEQQQLASYDGRRGSAESGLHPGKRLLPLFLAVKVITQQPERAEVDVNALAVGRRCGDGWVIEIMALLDLSCRSIPAPQNLAIATIDTKGLELFGRRVEAGEKHAIIPDARRRVAQHFT